MKKPALRSNRFKPVAFEETNWTKGSKNIGEYIFRRIALDQSSQELQNTRPMHLMSKLIITSKEINNYINDYLRMVDEKSNNAFVEKMSSKLKKRANMLKINLPEFLGHS